MVPGRGIYCAYGGTPVFYQVQWIDGRPSDSDVFRVLREAWNFLSIEEQILENDIDAIDDDDEY